MMDGVVHVLVYVQATSAEQEEREDPLYWLV